MAIVSWWKYGPSSFGYKALRRLASSHRPVQLANCAAVALVCLVLAGCSAPNFLADIYLVAFSTTASDRTAGFSHLEIRVGYFSLCARTSTGTGWTCGDPDRVLEHLRDVDEPWNLHKTAYDLRNEAISPSLPIISIALNLVSVFLISSFPITISSQPSGKPQANTTAPRWLLLSSFSGMASSLLAGIWQHAAVATAAPLMVFLSSGAVTAVVGPLATTLVWLSFGLTLITGLLSIGAVKTVVMRLEVYSALGQTGGEDVLAWMAGPPGRSSGGLTGLEQTQRPDDAAVASGARGGFPEAMQTEQAHGEADIELVPLGAEARRTGERSSVPTDPIGP